MAPFIVKNAGASCAAVVTLLVLALAWAGCAPGRSASKTIRAAEGGTIALADGTELEIPPGALEADTTITIRGVAGSGGLMLAGLVAEPDGLVFAKPATVRFPLPAGWDPEAAPVVTFAGGADVTEAMPTGAFAQVVNRDGRLYSEHAIEHFSCTGVSLNCHAGTLKHVLNTLEARGCSQADLLAAVNARYSGIPVDASQCASSSTNSIQAVLDSFFEDRGGWDPGVPMPASTLAQAIQAASEGKLVVLAFSDRAWGPRGGQHNFLPGGVAFAHSATLRVVDGQVVVHNTINTDNQKLRAHFGGEVTATWPADRLEEFRALKFGVALELQLCGAPDCLSYPEKNPFGLEVYAPLDGISSWIPGNSTAPRPVAYPSVRLYVERGQPSASGCPQTGAACEAEPLPNGGCGGNNIVCIGTVEPCKDPAGAGCCPADMCNYGGGCVQITCPAGGRNYDCECCCTAGSGSAGSCDDSATVFNVHDACRPDRLCACAPSAPTAPTTCR